MKQWMIKSEGACAVKFGASMVMDPAYFFVALAIWKVHWISLKIHFSVFCFADYRKAKGDKIEN